jgi:hypothetical protein
MKELADQDDEGQDKEERQNEHGRAQKFFPLETLNNSLKHEVIYCQRERKVKRYMVFWKELKEKPCPPMRGAGRAASLRVSLKFIAHGDAYVMGLCFVVPVQGEGATARRYGKVVGKTTCDGPLVEVHIQV